MLVDCTVKSLYHICVSIYIKALNEGNMKLINKDMTSFKERPIKVVQFGEGNFLRGFVDYMIDVANEQGLFNGNIVLVKPIEFGDLKRFDEQDCQYTLQLRGIVNDKEYVETRIITSIADAVDPFVDYTKYIDLAKLDSLRFVVSNTTEAGIVFDKDDPANEPLNISFPAKLTRFLQTRFDFFKGDPTKGLIILPVELIDDNGIALKKCVNQYINLWHLDLKFAKWVEEACIFTSTLVDRIVTGYPRDEADEICQQLGYQDNLLDTAEPFALWVIESAKDISNEFPMDKAMFNKMGMEVIFTDNQKPYKQRKVRILNGAHTSFVLASFLAGNDTVMESMNDNLINNYIKNTLANEVIPTLQLPKAQLEIYTKAVIQRFKNPFIKHQLLAISLNSVSKWRARCLPSFLGYIEKYHELPKYLTFSIAALLRFYTSSEYNDGVLKGYRDKSAYDIRDDEKVLVFFDTISDLDTHNFVERYLSQSDFHGQDLSQIKGLTDKVTRYLTRINENGMREAIAHLERD